MATYSLLRYGKNDQKKRSTTLGFTIPKGTTLAQFQEGLLLGYTQANSVIMAGCAIDTGTGATITFSNMLFVGGVAVSTGTTAAKTFNLAAPTSGNRVLGTTGVSGKQVVKADIGKVTATCVYKARLRNKAANGWLDNTDGSMDGDKWSYDPATGIFSLNNVFTSGQINSAGPFTLFFTNAENNESIGSVVIAVSANAGANTATIAYTSTAQTAAGVALPYYTPTVQPIIVRGTPPTGISGEEVKVILELCEFGQTDGYYVGPNTANLRPPLDDRGQPCVEFPDPANARAF